MTCKKCGNNFPMKMVIDGKKRFLANRRYCLVCSPFGKHNTRKLVDGIPIPKKCKRCGNILKNNRRNFCSGCNVTIWRKRTKKKLVEYKGGSCINCGYNKCNENLTFHHRDPNMKDFQISGMSLGIEKLKLEVDKCELLCRNCHGEVHAGILTI